MTRRGRPPALTKENDAAIARACAVPRGSSELARDAYGHVEAITASDVAPGASAGGSFAHRHSAVGSSALVADPQHDPRGVTQGLTQSRVAAARETSMCGEGTPCDETSTGAVRARARASGAARVVRQEWGSESCGPEAEAAKRDSAVLSLPLSRVLDRWPT